MNMTRHMPFLAAGISLAGCLPVADADAGGEREFDVEQQYVVPSSALRGLSTRLRSATYRSDFSRDADDVRVIVSYPLSLL